MRIAIIVLIFIAGPAVAQERLSGAENPLDQLKDTVKRVLAEAQLPFTEEQEKAIALMLEDRRQASEDLFGEIFDFRAGPTQGQQMDRARDAIDWIRGEFLRRLQDYLRPEQLAAWNRSESGDGREVLSVTEDVRPSQRQQTQYVRINNNAFTAEDAAFGGGFAGSFGYAGETQQYQQGGGNPQNFQQGGAGGNPGNFHQGGGGGNPGNFQQGGGQNRGGVRGDVTARTEVIQSGGTGAYHGNAQLLFKDESLNARNPFAHNKPPYQERQATFDFSGPVVPGRLTLGLAARQNEAQNIDTIHATLPEGLFDLGIGKPTVQRGANVRGTYQVTGAHSLTFNLGYGTNIRKNQGIGGFNLPERATNGRGHFSDIELRQFSSLSTRSIYETRFNLRRNRNQNKPVSENVSITVLDAFTSGGAPNWFENNSRNYEFGNLFTRLGEKWTLKTGFDGAYRKAQTSSRSGFNGAFTFSSLEAYRAGEALTYRVNRGDPSLDVKQLEFSFFAQNDFKLTPQFTLMLGGRYDIQTNLSDHNNLAPRLGIAYAPSRATVIRAGAGIYYSRMSQNIFESLRRLDGTRQYEIVIDNPSYPDPFQAGSLRNTFPSVRVTDPHLVAPYVFVASVSLERTFFNNLLLTASYSFNRENHRFRSRNLNAPLPGQTVRPDPNQGNVMHLESTGVEEAQDLRLNIRQRFSIFYVTANYMLKSVYYDAAPGDPFSPPANNYDLRSDWGRVYQRHQFNSAVNAQLPLGIFLTGSVTAASGRPYNITTGKDDNNDTQINDRPRGVPRNSAVGPGFLGFNFNISKAFFFGSANGGYGNGGTRTNINLFANMTNAFNHVNLGQPSGVMTSPNFGKSTSAQDPREIEVGLRFQF